MQTRDNPILAARIFARERSDLATIRPMTAEGAGLKAVLLTAVALAAAVLGWLRAEDALAGASPLSFGVALLGAALLALIITAAPRRSALVSLAIAPLLGWGAGGLAGAAEGLPGDVLPHLVVLFLAAVFALPFTQNAGLLDTARPVRSTAILGLCALFFGHAALMLAELTGVEAALLTDLPLGAAAAILALLTLLSLLLVADYDRLEIEAEQGAPPQLEWLGGVALLTRVLWVFTLPLALLVAAARPLRAAIGRRRKPALDELPESRPYPCRHPLREGLQEQ